MRPEIAAAFEAHPEPVRRDLIALRALILEVAEGAAALNGVEESLKWGQPSYAPRPKIGTPVRLGLNKAGAPTLFVHCGTTLIPDFAAAEPGVRVEGRRALIAEGVGRDTLARFILGALTYRALS